MKTTVIYKDRASVTVKPELLCLIFSPGKIVWKTGKGREDGYFAGIVLATNNSSLHPVGYQSDGWAESSFTRFNGTVVMENDQ